MEAVQPNQAYRTGEPAQPRSFGALLRHFRVRAALNQEALAERSGVGLTTVAALEQGLRRRPHLSTASALAEALALSPAEREALLGLAGGAAQRPQAQPHRPVLPVGATGREAELGDSTLERSAAPDSGSEREPSGAAISLPTSNLPAELSNLVGRETELATLTELLRGSRLVTLVGPGGVGKTRLALRVAATTRGAPDGVWLVELASLADPALLRQTVGAVLGLREEPGRSSSQILIDHLREKRALLVLDNCEHLAKACAELVLMLLQSCPGLRILTTSRAALLVRGEQIAPVPPLELPESQQQLTPEALAQVPAVALFLERARLVRPAFALDASSAPAVAELCRRLDGLPLAIELAAANTQLLPPQLLNQRLGSRFDSLSGPRDLPARQRTIRATLAWSHDLLSATAQQIYRCLSVFAGGCSLAAAESVCAKFSTEPILDTLSELVRHSLLQVIDLPESEPYVMMLETVRADALQRLAASPEADAVRYAQAAYFLNVAERPEGATSGPEQGRWLQQMEANHDNCRAALAWSRTAGAWEMGLRLSSALGAFWRLRGHYSEGAVWLESLLADEERAEQGRAPSMVRARALLEAGLLRLELGDPRAVGHLEASLALLRGLDEPRLLALALVGLGNLRRQEGALRRAGVLFEEALVTEQRQGNTGGVVNVLSGLGVLDSWLGDNKQATARMTEALRLGREMGDLPKVAYAQMLLANLDIEVGQYDRAEEVAAQSLETAAMLRLPREELLARLVWARAARDRGDAARAEALSEAGTLSAARLGFREGGVLGHAVLGRALQDQGKLQAAAASGDAALVLARDSTAVWPGLVAHVWRGQVAVAQADWTRGEQELALALELAHTSETVWGLPACLEGLATLAVHQTDPARAVRLLGAAEAIRAEQSVPVPPADRRAYDRLVAAVRGALGVEAFARAWAVGQKLPADQFG
jgi:predicted ATPase/transcriptional regulator with XRE-family HTH domain